jgi:GNAT superfamily N-acetyltransferase
MDIRSTKQLNEIQKNEIFLLWNNEYPKNLVFKNPSEFDNYLNNLTNQNHKLLINKKQKVVGWYFDFERENKKWFAMILDASIQKKGFGTILLNEAKKTNTHLNGWVIDHNKYLKQDGNHYKSPLQFYIKNGFKIIPTIRLELEKISAVKIHYKK